MPQVDTHLLASRDGYTTFAKSPSVTPTEQRELEELVYGQPDDAIVYAALTVQATAMLRRLRSTGRYALSRIIQGDRDSAGRDTIAVCTIILTAAQYPAVARGELWRFLHSPQLWAVTLFRSGQPLALPEMLPVRRAITSSDVTIFDTWMAARSRQNAVAMIGANPASHQAIIALLQVLAEKDLLELTWGCRLFSLPSSISVASIAQRGVEQNSRRIIVTPATSPTTTYGQRSLALVGTNRYLTSVIEPVTIAAKAPPYSAETFSPEEDAPSRAPSRQSGKRSSYTAGTGGESTHDSWSDILANFKTRKTVLFLFAGILALCVVVSPFWLVPQFQSSGKVTEQKIIALDAAKDAKSNKEKAVSAQTPEESKTFADDAEKSAVGSRTAADAAKKANENAGLFAVTADATAAQDAANSARADADAAKNATDEMIAAKAAKAADDAKAAADAKAVAEAEAKKVAADAKAVAEAEAKKAEDDAKAVAEAEAKKAEDEQPLTPTATDPILPAGTDVATWDTTSYINQLTNGLQKLSQSNSDSVGSNLDNLRIIAKEINQYEPEKIKKEVFQRGEPKDKDQYNRLLFIVNCANKVLESYENVPDVEMTKAWKLLMTLDVKNDRPKKKVIFFISKTLKDATSIRDLAIAAMPPEDSVPDKFGKFFEELARQKLLSSSNRVTFGLKDNTLDTFCICSTGQIILDTPKNFEDFFNGVPFPALAVVFSDQFVKWIDKRKMLMGKLSEFYEKNPRFAFPWKEIYTPLDEDIAALETCPIPQVASLAKSAQDLIDLCNEAAKPKRIAN